MLEASNGTVRGARTTYQQRMKRCGKPACRVCAAGAGHGPYWYAYWREGSWVRSRYIGSDLAPVACAESASAISLPGLRVQTLGRFQVWRGSHAVETSAWQDGKVAALFKCLLSMPLQRASRDELLECL
jgi:hypothetical protein